MDMPDGSSEDEEDWQEAFEAEACNKTEHIHNLGHPSTTTGFHSKTVHQGTSAEKQCLEKTAGPLMTGLHVSQQSKLGHSRTIIHIDLDCFYAQVEMVRNPELRNKPLGIQQKYLLVTCNYVARDFGVTKLMGIREALEKCPQLVIVNGEDLTHYREMSYKVTDFFMKYTASVERLGFDENFLDVTEMVQTAPWSDIQPDTGVQGAIFATNDADKDLQQHPCTCGCQTRLLIGSHIAAHIRAELYQSLGLTSCGGIAHNKVLAKLVGATHKPNQQTTLLPHDTDGLLVPLGKAKKLPGIGSSLAKKLAMNGVESVSDLRAASMHTLEPQFGEANAMMMKQLSFGVDDSLVTPSGLPQTMSDEDSFKKCSDFVDAKRRMAQLLDNLLQRLYEDGRVPQTLRLTVRKLTATNKWTNRESRQCPIPNHLFSTLSAGCRAKIKDHLMGLLCGLFQKVVLVKEPFHLTLINVCFAKLVAKPSSCKGILTYFSPGKACEMSPHPSRTSASRNSATKGAQTKSNASLISKDTQCERPISEAFLRSKNNNGKKFNPKSDFSTCLQISAEKTVATAGNREIQECNSCLPPITSAKIEPTETKDIDKQLHNDEKATVTTRQDETTMLCNEGSRNLTSKSVAFPAGESINNFTEEHGFDKSDKTNNSRKQNKICTVEGDQAVPSHGEHIVDCELCLPPGVDETVFRALPCNMQQEILEEYSRSGLEDKIKSKSCAKEIPSRAVDVRFTQSSSPGNESLNFIDMKQGGSVSTKSSFFKQYEAKLLQVPVKSKILEKSSCILNHNETHVDNRSDPPVSPISGQNIELTLGLVYETEKLIIPVSKHSETRELKDLTHKISTEASLTKPMEESKSVKFDEKTVTKTATKCKSLMTDTSALDLHTVSEPEFSLNLSADKTPPGNAKGSSDIQLAQSYNKQELKEAHIPLHIDKSVFSALPSNVQQELITDWEIQQLQKQKPTHLPKMASKPGIKRKSVPQSNAPSKSTRTIQNYFKPRTGS